MEKKKASLVLLTVLVVILSINFVASSARTSELSIGQIEITPENPMLGEVVSTQLTIQNTTPDSVTFSRLGVGVRGPNCADFTCANIADFPLQSDITIEAGETFVYEGAQSFWVKGDYIAQVVYLDADNIWRMFEDIVSFSIEDGLAVESDLTFSPDALQTSDLIFAEMTLRNEGTRPISLQNVTIGARGTTCIFGDFSCADNVDFGTDPEITLAAGESRTFEHFRMLRDEGVSFAQIAVRDALGTWYPLGDIHSLDVTAPIERRTTEWQLGVQIHPLWQKEADRARFELAKSVGADVVRIAVSWRLLEKDGKGNWDDWYIGVLDETIESANETGLDVLLMFSGTPCWASSDPDKNCTLRYPDTRQFNNVSLPWQPFYPPENTQDYADGLLKLVELHGEDAIAFEVWNEPNIERFWKPEPDVKVYTSLLADAHETVKADYPDIVLLGGSLAGADVDYLSDMLELGSEFDGLALHPYTLDSPASCDYFRASFGCGVEAMRGMMLHHGISKPIWITEFGWNSLPAPEGVGEAGQAAFTVEALELVEYWDDVPLATIYNLVNTNGNGTYRLQDDYFGLFDGSLEPKAVANWLQVRAGNVELEYKVFVPIVAGDG